MLHDIIKTLFTSFLKNDNQRNILISANYDISNDKINNSLKDKSNPELDKEKGNTDISIKDTRTCSEINEKFDCELEKK
ncbi:hypothetical protein PBNK65E_000407800 [Plasmodium berghei]|uniref:Uncharacterized protein n=1 Tax=Plasmodium berghei TaxID=5821 RepID=A0A113SRC2_PLABE|nr:hypothetical protein PBK173_000418500 [Plasmodium berghei]SCL98509.1 hypothetical protein PBNK65NY_000407200 [Plasmodium berghei]SCM16844.1 hypothetical protein PBSP11A_000407700 [Plasmodium berghei]SCM18642.1 hypothetical protein PBSP11RLL_000407900 [Plasmodium berghei]SCN28077.1 hypothetical protein PBNK65E_000407800 [Plasmodium berghei]